MKSILKINHKKIKIVALPFAGGSRYSYRGMQNLFPEDFIWVNPELPGRGERMNENCLSTIGEMTEDLLNQVLPLVVDSEYILYGHSMGTLLACELTRSIIAAGLNPPILLYLTGRAAPSVSCGKAISGYDKTAFWEEIGRLGGLPNQVLEQENLLYFFESQLRSDFKAIEAYRYKKLRYPLPVPIYLCTGMEENIAFENMLKWQKETAYPLTIQNMPGNHFFIFQHPQALIKRILQAYYTCKAQYKPTVNFLCSNQLFFESSQK